MIGWQESIKELSGNLTTNEYLPEDIRKKLLFEDSVEFEELYFPPLCQELQNIEGIDILSGLQKLEKKDNLTVFRAIRFPTMHRIRKTIHELGLSMPNHEQERILRLYTDKNYLSKRDEIKNDNRFCTQPQERVVDGVPVFSLVNDALQIHRAYRGCIDKVLIIGIHIPYELFDELKLIANTAIDLDYDNSDRDFEIVVDKGVDYHALRVRGIDLHEMHIQGLPFDLEGHKNIGIEQKFFLLDIYKIDELPDLSIDVLKEYEYFLHGFYGDQNVFGRSETKYLPSQCHEVKVKT